MGTAALLVMVMGVGVEAITSSSRSARQARADLLGQHCVVKAGCRRMGDNMLNSLVTEFPFVPPGISSSRKVGDGQVEHGQTYYLDLSCSVATSINDVKPQ